MNTLKNSSFNAFLTMFQRKSRNLFFLGNPKEMTNTQRAKRNRKRKIAKASRKKNRN